VDEETAGAGGVEEGGVDAGDFVADFPGGAGAGDGEAGLFEDGVVGGSNAGGFAGAAGGVGAGDDAALHAEAALDFFAEIPGGGAAGHDDFVEYPEVGALFDGADGGHGVDVEVHAQQEGDDGEVLDDGVDVRVGEGDGDEAGEVLEAGLEFLAEGANVELASGGLDFFGRDVVALDGGELPAGPVGVGFFAAIAPEVVEPAGGAVGGGDEEGPALFVGEGRADDLEPDVRRHEGGFVEDYAGEASAAQGHGVLDALEFDGGAVDEFEFEVGFVFGLDPGAGDQLFEGLPGDILRHPVGRGAVEERFAGAFYSSTQKFDAREVAFAEAAAGNEDSEAFAA